MTTHTPGPWLIVDGKPFVYALNTDGLNRWSLDIQHYWRGCSDDELMANARLIAAAPDLLSIARRWAALDGGAWHVARHAAEKAQLMADTLAAIAKASPPPGQ